MALVNTLGGGIFLAGPVGQSRGDPDYVASVAAQIAVAEALGSRALRADAVESITCGWLSFVVLIGVLAQLALGAWWVDSVTSLVIVGLLIKEGREAWTGDDQKGDRHEEF
jgi:hypothetical protein